MSKKFLAKLICIMVVAVATVFWLLSIIIPETFGFFNLTWAGLIVSAGLGLTILLVGVFEKNITTIKKIKIWVGIGLLIVALFCLISALTIPNNLVAPIIALILVFGLLVSLLATGGNKWDESDNNKVGYKNYFQRKKEENTEEQTEK